MGLCKLHAGRKVALHSWQMANGACARPLAGFVFPLSKQQSSNTDGICWASNTVQACHCRPTLCALSVHSPSPVYTAEEDQAWSWLICSVCSTADHQYSRMTSLADDELSMHRTALWPCSSASRVCQPLSAKCRCSTAALQPQVSSFTLTEK